MVERVTADGAAAESGLAGLFEPQPRFRRRLFGYDRADVDDYLAWLSAEREAADTCAVAGSAGAPDAPDARDAVLLVAAMRQLLDLAEQRAAEMVDAALAEAEQIRADARLEAAAQVRAARDLDAVTREGVRRNAGELLSEATAEQARLADEVARLRQEVAELQGQRDELGSLLARIAGALSSAVEAVGGSVPELLDSPRRGRVVLTGNVVREESTTPVAG